MSAGEVSNPLGRAWLLISEHPAVSCVGEWSVDEATGATTIEVTFNINLPSEWRSVGESPSGVRLTETVQFSFPVGFPFYPPEPSLREDFTRNLPHMQPWTDDGRPVPCVYDGDLAELLHQQGLAGILNQTAVWLDRAALGMLIDPEQGWEPVRRDAFSDLVVADAELLREWADTRGGFKFVRIDYLKVVGETGAKSFVHSQLSRDAVNLNRANISKFVSGRGIDGNRLHAGSSLALIAWPGAKPSGEPIICDTYLPETVGNVQSLEERASLYGCRTELDEGLNCLSQCLFGNRSIVPFPLVVILLARRPYKLIGSESSIELCPYIVDIVAPRLFGKSPSTLVRAAAHRTAISRSLLVRMAEGDAGCTRSDWTLIGAGSLGSKLALHLARSGQGPTVIVDQSNMSPHNAARHALIPAAGDMQLAWTDEKVRLLSGALAGLDQNVEAVPADAAGILMSGNEGQSPWTRPLWAVVNTTASLALREALGATEWMPSRVVETSLFAGGRVGAITVEGPERNPSTTDLMAEVYAIMGEDPALRQIVFDGDDAVARQSTGQGCGSLTMAMSDGRLSLFAAGAAEYLLNRRREGLPAESGEVVIGRLSDNGLGVDWRTWSISPATVLHANNGLGWRVHVHERALLKMRDEASRWPSAETGGVLMGRLSEVSRVAHVVDVLEAPEDSVRSRHEFVLGTKGLRGQVDGYSDVVNWSLYCLGTWHSHLCEGGASPTDLATAKAVSLARLTPSIFLIMTPTKLHALAAGLDVPVR